MKILNVNMSIDPVLGGGTAERTVQMSRFLASKGHDCTILTLDTGITSERLASLPGITVVALPCLVERFHMPTLSVAKIMKLVEDCDIVHLMAHWPALNALVYWCIRAIGKPYVVCPAGSLPIFGRSKWRKKLFNLIVGKAMVRNANRCIACAPSEIANFAPFDVQRDAFAIITNGIRLEDYAARDDAAFRRKNGLAESPFILFVGRLNPIKGPDLLLRAFCAVRNDCPHHLVFAGPDDGMLGTLRAMAASEGVESRVHFIGYVEGAEKSWAYHAAEFIAIPTRSEPLSIVLLEAGASGAAVLVTDQCGFNDVEQLGGGVVVPASVDGLKAGLVDMISRTRDLGPMGGRLRAHVERLFTWEAVGLKYLELYSSILEPRDAAA